MQLALTVCIAVNQVHHHLQVCVQQVLFAQVVLQHPLLQVQVDQLVLQEDIVRSVHTKIKLVLQAFIMVLQGLRLTFNARNAHLVNTVDLLD